MIRRGDAAGGPIDPGSAPFAVVDDTNAYAISAPAVGEIRRYRINVRDADTGLEEPSSHEAVLRGDSDNPLASQLRPRPPGRIDAVGSTAGAIALTWDYLHPIDERAPSGFAVRVAPAAGAIDEDGAPAAIVVTIGGRSAYGVTVAGLNPGSAYRIAVRAFNGAGADGSTASTLVVAGRDDLGAAPEQAAAISTWNG